MLPALAIVGRSGATLPFAVLIGAIETGVAGSLSLAVAWSTLPWFLFIAIASSFLSSLVLIKDRRRIVASGEQRPRRNIRDRWPGAAAVTVLILTLIWCLLPLRAPSVGWDARAIWLLRSSWFAGGHNFLLASFRSPGSIIAHSSYPPLVSTSVAVTWQLTGDHTERVGVVVVAFLNAVATFATAWVIVEASRNLVGGQRRGKDRPLALIVGVVGAVLFTLATFKVFGPFSTNGYADPLWSVAAVGAIGYGLVLPTTKRNVGAAAILLAVSGLTKTEGTATAVVLVVLITLRYSSCASPSFLGGSAGSRWRWRAVAAGATGLVLLSVWPILARLEHATRDVNTSGQREGTWDSRTHVTVSAMAPYLHVLLVAAPLALVAGVVLRRHRERAGLGNDLWAWLGLLGGLSVIGASYITGPGNTAFWLYTSVHRTTMFAAIAAWLIVSIWAVVAIVPSEENAVARAPSRDTQLAGSRSL
jgi:hypothetical protein